MLEFNKPEIYSELSEDGRHGKITIQPLERGYGTTIGNSLRRVLLSSVPGCAVTSIRIDGALHEFTTLSGVKEDVTEIVLNVKGIVAKMERPEPKTAIIDITGPCDVCDSDIKADSDLVLLNPEHHIATVSEGFRFYMELTFEHGRGYVSQEKNKLSHNTQTIGEIYVDSIFTPVYSVNYNVQNTRVGSSTDYDRLTIALNTNGVLDANEAIVYASNILNSHFNVFNELSEGQPEIELKPSGEEQKTKIMAITLEELQLSVRSFNCLKRAGIDTVEGLTQRTVDDMMKIRNLGKKSFDEIRTVMNDMGLDFMDEDE